MSSRNFTIKSDEQTHQNKNDKKSFYYFIPARYLFVFMSFLAFNLVYAYKVVFSVVIVAMVGHHTNSNNINVTGECFVNGSANYSESIRKGEFAWTQNQQSILLGAYYYGYVITQLPAGFLSDRYGAKWIFGVSMFVTGLLSLLIPFAARIHWFVFFSVLFLQGDLKFKYVINL